MRKLLVALMIVAFAATAFAEVKIAGYYNVNGWYKSNIASVDNDTDDKNMFYEQEWKINLNAQTDKDTYFKSQLEISDNTIEKSVDYAGSTHFQVERAYLGHNFGALTLDVGIMDGGAWSYAFANDKEGYFRVKATIPAAGGKVFLITQKNKEANETATYKDAEKDDSDTYYIAYSGKMGGITVAPLFGYTMNGAVQATDGDVDATAMSFQLGLGGNFGAVGFEFDSVYNVTDPEAGDNLKNYGAFLNVFGKAGAAKVGAYVAYASADEDNAFDMKDDFDDVYAGIHIYDEYKTLKGLTVIGVYGSTAINAKTSVEAGIAYAMSNADANNAVAKATFSEDTTAVSADVTLSYAITEALSYDAMIGYISVDEDGGDVDPAYVLKHGLTLSF
jgi:hypothetical protein